MRVFRFLSKSASLIFIFLRIMSDITLQTQIRGRYIKTCLFLNHRTWVEFALAGYFAFGRWRPDACQFKASLVCIMSSRAKQSREKQITNKKQNKQPQCKRKRKITKGYFKCFMWCRSALATGRSFILLPKLTFLFRGC